MAQKNFRKYRPEETALYVMGWCCLAALALFFALCPRRPGGGLALPDCRFHAFTGFYCPGCGGTRAVRALFGGRFLAALRYHPFVAYLAATGGWFMVSQTVQRISGGRAAIGMRHRDAYLWAALGIVAINFLLKNILLACGVDLLR